MQALLKLYWEIVTFRRGPQDVPASSVLFVLLLLATLVYDVVHLNLLVQQQDRELSFGTSVLLSLAVEATRLGIVWAVLWLMGLAARVLQTWTAMLGAELLLGLAALPFNYMAGQAPQDANPFTMLMLLIMLWTLIVDANILRHALSRSYLVAAILVLGQLLVVDYIIATVAPLGGK